MHTTKRLKIYCALLLLIAIVASTVASVGTSYAHFVYTGEHQVVLHKAEETKMESNVMFPQGCTVVLDEWNMNSSCEPQTITASFYGKEAKGRISCSITQEYSKYYTVAVTDTAGTPITENDEISVTEDGTDVIITVTPVKDKLNTLTTAISAEVLLTFTELEETTLEDGTVIVSDGDKMSGTLKWKVTPLDEPLPEHPPIPTATVTEIANDKLVFALNFKADEVTQEQLAYYGSWYADFELKVNKDVTFNSDGSADGWLSGQYDAWSENWVNVPFEDVTLKAGETLKIMEYAAELMGQPGLKYTYAEVYESVKEFNCGVFFDKEYLEANPDLEVTLELRMYNPANKNESYVIGDTYTFTIEEPEIPTATVTEIENEDLTFALNFKADAVTALQLDYYGSWYADFELKVNKDVTFNSDGSADGWLSGQYDAWSENWVNVPFEDVTLSANTPLKIMEYAAELMGQSGLKYTYAEVYEGVKEFNCGVFFDSEFLIANPDLEVTLELRMYNPEDETESYVIGETYSFTYEAPAVPTASVTVITNDELTFAMNFKAAEVTEEQLAYYSSWYTDYEITLNKPITFHGNGSADGWLSGQLDAWSANWVKMPLTAVSLTAGQSFKIMEYASEILNKPNYSYTFGEVYEGIKDFDCGVFFNEAYLAANPDLEVILELRMYNPANETEYYIIGDTYKFYARDLNVSTEEEQPEETIACGICGLTDHTTENHPAETVVCENCGLTDHTTENCPTSTDTESTENNENSGNSENTVTDETVAATENTDVEAQVISENTETVNAESQSAAAMMNVEAESLTVTPMLFAFTPVLTTVNDTIAGSEVQTEAVNSTEIYPLTANMSNVSVAHNTDVITYTYITYPAGTKSIVITDFENVVVDEGTRHISNFTPYTQVHTEEMIYVLPYGKSFTIETDPAAEGSVSLKIVSKGAYVQEEETDTPETDTPAVETDTPAEETTETNVTETETNVTETETNVTETNTTGTDVTETDTTEETENSAEEEEIVFTSKAVKWHYESGTTVLQTSENICYEIDGSEFDNNSPLTEILSAAGPVVFKTMPETDGKTVYSVEYYSNGAYTPAAAEDFSIEIDETTDNLILNTGEHYPQAGIYRVCLQLQKNNNLSAYYKTFFVNYR